MVRFGCILLIVLCLFGTYPAAASDDDDVRPGIDLPWDDNESTEFPSHRLGWWETYLEGPPQGIQILPNGSMQFMDRNPANRTTDHYRVMRVVGDNIYLVYKRYNDYLRETDYIYLWLKFEPKMNYTLMEYGPLTFMEFKTTGSITEEEFKTHSPRQLWEKFSSQSMGWTIGGRYIR